MVCNMAILLISTQSGDGPRIPLVEANQNPKNAGERWKVTEKMNLTTQYAFSGDYTGEVECGA
jgi:von Willebrand factor A domain-containing protein 8